MSPRSLFRKVLIPKSNHPHSRFSHVHKNPLFMYYACGARMDKANVTVVPSAKQKKYDVLAAVERSVYFPSLPSENN